jgi:anti-sigma-K factor RskA
MSGKLERYNVAEVVEHLASNYVLGTLSERARNRLEKLRGDPHYQNLNRRIQFWENHMSPLNEKVPELKPHKDTWSQIHSAINPHSKAEKSRSWFSVFKLNYYQIATACSLILIAWLGFNTLVQQPNPGALSYIAVLNDSKQQPRVVAATYGDSQTLMLDIVSLPSIDAAQSFELWVTSKSDKQTRSLGEIPPNLASFNRKLSDAEWRLIKDSDSLLITIEEAGGSPIGEPMGRIVSKGVCVRLSAWQKQA